MSRQALKIWNETTYAVFANPTTPVKNTDYIVASLDQGNAFGMRPQQVQNIVRTSDGYNRRMKMVSGQTKITGKISTLLYPEQTQFIMNWATLLSAGMDLPSCTIDHQFPDVNASYVYRRYLGCKITGIKLAFTADSPLLRCDLDIVASKPSTITITDFPEPPSSDYVAGNPYAFFNMASPGNLTLSSSRSEFREFSLTAKNMVDSPFFESQYATRATFCGRDWDLTAKLALKGNADRLAYESTTAETVSARFDNGTRHVIFTLNNVNYMTSVEDDLSLDHIFYQTLNYSNFYDPGVSTDFSFTAT